MLDLLEQTGAHPIGLTLDESGIVPSSLEAALSHNPVALLLQPRAHNPTGVSMAPRRAKELAVVLDKHMSHPGVVIVEDDHAAGIAGAPTVSLGTYLPGRTVHIRSFAKSLGPDLRLAAVSGPADVISPLADRRMLGPGWSSRLLQHVLLGLLTSPGTAKLLDQAREEYARRRASMLESLALHGARATADDGINLWLEVGDQQTALVSLAANAIAVAPGSPFEVTALPAQHVRITVGLVRDGFDELARILAEAARPPGRLNRGTR